MPKVSVIIPIYGVEKYIERCARSLFEQTLDSIEFIFVDDCTPDHSIEILKSIIEEYRLRFEEKNYTVRIERMPTNSGLANVRRHGIQLATGDYIAHCDSDDWVDTDMYRAMYEKAIEDQADMVVSDYYRSDGITHKGDTGFCSIEREQFIKEMLYMRTSWAVWNKMVKREVYHPNFVYPVGAMAEDMLISTQLALFSNRISFLRKALYYYFDNPTSIVNTTSPEDCMIKFKQGTDNATLLASIILNTPEYRKYRAPLYYAMFFEKSILLPYLHLAAVKKVFYQRFKGIEIKVLRNSDVPLKIRLKCLLIASHLYSFVNRK